ncbi:bifunctional DNA primase/polymerase [Gordonia sp. NPDC003376]
MPVNDDTPNPILADGYADAAPQYWAAGWRGILPMPRGKKFPPPTSYTGYQALTPSYPDIQAWCEERPDGNTALHLPDTIIGIDVDAYDGRTGAGTLAYAEHLWVPLPATVRTTSRDDAHSGIRLYRVPAGTRLATKIEFPDVGLGHIEIVQASHRYAVVWPSLHPVGARYRWQDADGFSCDIPSPDDLPDLPEGWITPLTAGVSTVPTSLASVDVTHAIAGLTDGTMDLAVSNRLNSAILDLPGAASRHDTTCAHVLALLRMSEQGYAGVQQALSVLGSAFAGAVTKDGTRSDQQARSEFARMISNERGHQLIASSPTVVDVTEVLRINTERRQPEPTEDVDTPEVGDEDDDPGTIQIPDAEFWAAKPYLTAIYEMAHSRLSSPWSVLGCCIARVLAATPPWITLPPFIGGRGSLNTFIAIVGHSGQGKGASEAVAELLVPLDPSIGELPAGSGEGLAHSYVHRAGPKEKDDAEPGGIIRDRTSCLFSIPEVDTLTAVGGRQGATIMSKLRSAYSGEEIGFSYADPTKRLLVGKHQYRMALILGVQASRARPLIDDAAGGTPQRFVWLPANDPEIGSVEGKEHPPIDYTRWVRVRGDLDIPEIAKTTIRESRIARARGEGNALDGHTLFTREKVMVALCALDGRTTPDEWDWHLAGAVMAKSEAVRAEIGAELAAESEREAVARGESMGISQAVRDDAAVNWKAARVSSSIMRALDRKGPSLSASELLKSISSRDRAMVTEALERLERQGLVEIEEVVTDGSNGHRITLSEVAK